MRGGPHFPILNLFGEKGTGKTTLAVSLQSFFLHGVDPPNLGVTSVPAMNDRVSQAVNTLAVLDEYKNDLDIRKIAYLKGLWAYPSAKYGYVVPANDVQNKGTFQVSRFTEKPDMMTAEKLISEGAFWNGGVFAFRLGYMTDIVARYIEADTFAEIRSRYGEFPKISFDYEVAEKAQSVAVAPFAGEWKDLGTWNTLTDELSEHTVGNVVMDDESENTHVINELELPIMCIGARNLVIAASNDGILISDKSKSENIKTYADCLQRRPMFEERRWGEYKVVNTAEFPDGCKSLTKQLKINAGKSISYQMHRHRDEVWTFIDGEGELLLDGVRSVVGRGDTVMIRKGAKHAVKAISDLTFIEVQSGDLLVEEDIERFN